MCFRHRLLGVQVFAPYRGIFKPPLEVVVMTSGKYTYKHDVEIPMLKIKGKWYVDYQSVNVIDELLGGYQTAYSELYQRAFEELMEYYGMTEGDESSDE